VLVTLIVRVMIWMYTRRRPRHPCWQSKKFDTPQEIEMAKLKFNRKALGFVFKGDQRVVSGILDELAQDWTTFEPIANALDTEGKTIVDGYEITKEMIEWTKTKKKVHEIKFTPSVIEPSFGMGRVLYSLLEHSFYQRDTEDQRCVMGFNPQVAPLKCAVLPLSNSKEMNVVVDEIAADLMASDLSVRVDTSSTALGRRYARVDEIGVPFAVTVDFDTLKNDSVTLRERDTCVQIRLPKDEVTRLLFDIIHRRTTWEETTRKYPIVTVAEEDGEQSSEKVDGPLKIVDTGRGSFHRPV